MDYTILGLAAGTLTTVAYLPQLIKVLYTKRTRDLSLIWLVILGVGILVWFIYGLLVNSIPLIFGNFFILIMISVILFYKIRNMEHHSL